MPELMVAGAGPARCKLCGAEAAGPCVRCRAMVCADCCELTEGGAGTFALCLTCVKRGGKSFGAGWLGLVAWLGPIVLGILAIAVALAWLRR